MKNSDEALDSGIDGSKDDPRNYPKRGDLAQ
jgi:hypothetical protein